MIYNHDNLVIFNLALSPGHSRLRATLRRQEWPGDKANSFSLIILFGTNNRINHGFMVAGTHMSMIFVCVQMHPAFV